MSVQLPPIAPFPPIGKRNLIERSELESFLNAWLLLSQKYLTSPAAVFLHVAEGTSLTTFLLTFFESPCKHQEIASPVTEQLRKTCLLLVHRMFSEAKTVPASMLEWRFLANLSLAYPKSKALKKVLGDAWHRHKLDENFSITKSKKSEMSLLERLGSESSLSLDLARFSALAHVCYPYGQYLMTGADFMDSIVAAYDHCKESPLRKSLLSFAYVCLGSLMNKASPKTSSLLDYIYTLKTTTLLKSLVEETPFKMQFDQHISVDEGASKRATPLVEFMSRYSKGAKTPRAKQRNSHKGKYPATSTTNNDSIDGFHVHKMSLVTQIQDLFPDLGSGFVLKLLDEYHDNAEEVTAHLLDDTLPVHLMQADRSEDVQLPGSFEPGGVDLAPRRTPSPPLPPSYSERRNVYDDEDFDNLTIDASKLHIGRKNAELTADQILAEERPSNQKAAILSALAAFDSDDDERDDTYDVEDVGGTVDTTYAGDDPNTTTSPDKNDEVLYRVYKVSPDIFKRDAETRRAKARVELRNETGMADEAIEGWAVMLEREPQRQRRLERAQQMDRGVQQTFLEATAWRAESGTEGTEDSDLGVGSSRGGFEAHGRGANRGRGFGRGGRGRGNASGPSSEADTQATRRRKDANKGSRANHNRRDQRARKMGRGGFPG